MTKNKFFNPLQIALWFVVCSFLFPLLSVGASPPEKRPNVVFVVADDMRWDVMSCRKHPFVHTPTMDRIAGEGVLFENAFANFPTCSPSRASILTGRYPHKASSLQIIGRNNSFLQKQTTLAEMLHNNGYYTGHIGKWHLGDGHLPKKGYDHWEGFDWVGKFFDTELWINGKKETFQGFSDDILASRATKFVSAHARQDQPFFLFVGIKAPHHPYCSPDRLGSLFADDVIPKPDSYNEAYAESGKSPLLDQTILKLEMFQGGLPQFKTWDNYIKSYYRSVKSIDDTLKTILLALEQNGIADNTLFVFTSDHGYSLGDHGLTEKHFLYEEDLRVPYLIRYPEKVSGGMRRQEMVLNMDLAATIADYTKTDMHGTIDGVSLRPLLENQESVPWRKQCLFYNEVTAGPAIPGQIALRTEQYKLIVYPLTADMELYDLRQDPKEMRNLLKNPDKKTRKLCPELLADLKKEMRDTDYSLRETLYATGLWISDTVPSAEADEWAANIRLNEDGIPETAGTGQALSWKKIAAKDISFYAHKEEGDQASFFILLPMDRLSEWDPYVEFNLICAKEISVKAYFSGKPVWDRKEKLPGNRCNVPLNKGRNAVVFRLDGNVRGFKLLLTGPLDQVSLPLGISDNLTLVPVEQWTGGESDRSD